MTKTKVPFWDPKLEYNKYKTEINEAVLDVLASGNYIAGYGVYCDKFEEEFANFLGVGYAVMSGSGTQSLLLAYKALGIGPGDEVITVSHTFVATIDQIVAVGATPVLIDINKRGLMDTDLIECSITPRTKAIVPVHLEGKMCDMGRIMDIARRYNLYVIEDAAQAVGAEQDGMKAGTIGDVGCFSFYPAKILGCAGNAGMLVTNNKELADYARLSRCNFNIGKNPSQNVDFGFNLEPDTIQAAILSIKMKYLNYKIKRRQEVAEMYDKGLKGLPLATQQRSSGEVCQDYVILAGLSALGSDDNVKRGQKRELVDFLKSKGIGTLGHNLTPNHRYQKLGLHFSLPVTERYIREQVRIPCNPEITNEQVEYVIKVIKEFYEK